MDNFTIITQNVIGMKSNRDIRKVASVLFIWKLCISRLFKKKILSQKVRHVMQILSKSGLVENNQQFFLSSISANIPFPFVI